MLILTVAPDAWTTQRQGRISPPIDEWETFTKTLAAADALVDRHMLRGAYATTTLRVRPDGRELADGPFAENDEQLVGVYIIEAQDLDTALDWASRAPNARCGSVEVRPVLPNIEIFDAEMQRSLALAAPDNAVALGSSCSPTAS